MRLSHKDHEALQKTIFQLHEFDDLDSFRRGVPGIFLKIIRGDYFLVTDYVLNPRRHAAKLLEYFESDTRMTPEGAAYGERHVFSHPFTRYFIEGGAPTALKQSDFLTLTQLRSSPWGEGMRRYTNIERMISVPLASGAGNATVLNVGRLGKDYSERDRLILNLLRPHYDQACRKLKRLAELLVRLRPPLAVYQLTSRETEVARWLAEGKTNPEIATILNASPRTVEKHVERVLEKLGAENRTTAALMLARARA